MAIQWADDFSRYGTGTSSRTAMLDGLPYGIINASASKGFVTDDPDPNESGRAFLVGDNTNNWERDFRIALPTVVSGTVGIAFRAWLTRLPLDAGERPALVGIQRGDGAYLAYMQVEQNGSITVQARTSGTISEVADSVNPLVSPSSWNHYEFIHNIGTGAGSLRINGVERLTWTGVDTADNAELVNFSGRTNIGATATPYLKDLVIWDGTGSQNNSAMGTVIVRRLKPNADIALGDWSPSTGSTGTPLLAKDAPDDTTYLSAADTPMPSADMRFNLENLPPDITSIRGLVPVVRMRKVDGGDATVQNALSPNGTNWDSGADRAITTAFTYYFDISELDPATAAAWTPVAVDSGQLRIDRTT